MFHSNDGSISYRFRDTEIDGDFCQQLQNFATPMYFAPPLKGFPWKWVPVLGVKKLEWWGYRAKKAVRRYLQPSGHDRQTEPGDSKDLRCAVMKEVSFDQVLKILITNSCSFFSSSNNVSTSGSDTSRGVWPCTKVIIHITAQSECG